MKHTNPQYRQKINKNPQYHQKQKLLLGKMQLLICNRRALLCQIANLQYISCPLSLKQKLCSKETSNECWKTAVDSTTCRIHNLLSQWNFQVSIPHPWNPQILLGPVIRILCRKSHKYPTLLDFKILKSAVFVESLCTKHLIGFSGEIQVHKRVLKATIRMHAHIQTC